MQVYWLEQTVAEVRAEADWLSEAERTHLRSLRVPKRAQDWRLGRWTAKHATAAYLKLGNDPFRLAAIEIRPAPSGAPEAFVDGQAAPVSLSITHREGRAACAVAEPGTALGCDLEVVEPRSDCFVGDYFTAEEQSLLARAAPGKRFAMIALLWSAKESVLKALRTGLRLDVRSVAIGFGDTLAAFEPDSPATEGWRRFSAHHGEATFSGYWHVDAGLVRTMVSAPEAQPPLRLAIANASFTGCRG